MRDVKTLLKYMAIGIAGFLAIEFTYEVGSQTFMNAKSWYESRNTTQEQLEQMVANIKAQDARQPASR